MPFSGALGISPSDVAISGDGSRIYAAGKANSDFFPYQDGNLRIYDSASGQLVTTLAIGKSLGAVDLSPDGSFLMVTELLPTAGYATVYKVDLATLTFQTFSLAAPTAEVTPFYDVAVLSDGTVLLSVGLSGSNLQAKLLDVSTGTFTDGPSLQAHSYLTPSEDGSVVLVGQAFMSVNALMTYQTGAGNIAYNDPFAEGITGGGASRQAINARSGLIAEYANGLQIYDLQMHHLTTIATNFADGMTFDRSGEFLYVTDYTTQSIIQYSTLNWAVMQTISVGRSFIGGRDTFGGTLTLSPDGSFFAIMAGNQNPFGSQLIELANPALAITPGATAGDDTLNGTDGTDILYGLGGDDAILGNGGNDYLYGGDDTDALTGGAGDDVLIGGLGANLLDGSAGSDTASYAAAAAGVTVDLSLSSGQDTHGAGVDTLISIENLYGSAFSDALTGDTGANVIRGQAGDDTLVGGAGNDELNGGSGIDTVDYSRESGSGAIFVNLSTGAIGTVNGTVGAGSARDSFGNIDVLSSIEHIITGGGNDTIRGGLGAEILEAGAGNDSITSGGGADTLIGGTGDDVYNISDAAAVVVENAGEGTDRVVSSVSYTLRSNVENLTLSGNANISGTGNEHNNSISGNLADNVLVGGAGNDTINGSLGFDTVDYSQENGGRAVYVNLDSEATSTLYPDVNGIYAQVAARSALDTFGNTDRLTSIEHVIGSSADDRIFGSSATETLEGGSGNDYLTSGGGNDTLLGGLGNDVFVVWSGDIVVELADAGHDTIQTAASSYSIVDLVNIEDLVGTSAAGQSLTGNSGNNLLLGLEGNDIFIGGAGNDVLIGRWGSDTLTGGSGDDSFSGQAGWLDGDTITDFSDGDRIRISDATLANFTFSLVGHTLTFTGGSLTLTNLPVGRIAAQASAAGGVELVLKPKVPHPAHNDFNGDGKSDILWRDDNGLITESLGQANGGFEGNAAVTVAVSTDWKIAALADFNGDGLNDILWRNGSGTISESLGRSNGGFEGNAPVTVQVDNDWRIAAIGDFNGDGKSDILWRNSSGLISESLGQSNGGFVGNAPVTVQVSTDWSIAAIGDFNGDGLSDILWRNVSGLISESLGHPNGGFEGNAPVTVLVSTDWHIVGTGDFNGDGFSDILWRNDNGLVSESLGESNGGFAGNPNVSTQLSADWHVAAIGDYNGDGIDDILLQNKTGQIAQWLGQTNGALVANAAINANPGAQWIPQDASVHDPFA